MKKTKDLILVDYDFLVETIKMSIWLKSLDFEKDFDNEMAFILSFIMFNPKCNKYYLAKA